MDVVRLGAYDNDSPDYIPDRMIEKYSSMIWTERARVPGDFQLKTPYIDETAALLPEKTMISHRQTREVMMVESLLITKDESGLEELTITGRSVDFILESRFLEGIYQKRRQLPQEYDPLGAALVLLWNAIDNRTGFDVTRQRKDADPDDDQFHDGDRWEWTTKDALPNIAVSDSMTPEFGGGHFGFEDVVRWWVKEGMLLEQLQKIMDKDDLLLRTIRPPTKTSYGVAKISVDSVPPGFGEIIRNYWTVFNELRFDVYQGVDRSVGDSYNPPVIFDVMSEDFAKTQDLWSIKELKTGMEIMSDLNRKKDVYLAGQAGLTGWDRRIAALDAGSPELPPKPDYPGKNASDAEQTKYENKLNIWQAKRDSIYNDFENDYEKDATRALKQAKAIRLFAGDISPDTQYVYKKDYDLGDTVTLRGSRGLKSKATVDEYVRTDDAEGDRGYPTLTIL